ncbi:MAG: histidine phosphatase family protein [Comamonas sp.]
MTDIILIRHGETDWNREFRFQGHSDVPLNGVGHEQARRLVEALRDEPITHVVSSDLTRTQQTAAPLLRSRGLTLTALPQWREQAFGDFEGQRLAELPQQYPEIWAQWRRHDPDFRLPGASESRRHFQARAVRALFDQVHAHEALAREQPGGVGRLVVFTHGGLLDMLYRAATGASLQGPRVALIPNAGINRLRVSGQRIEIIDWAEDGHLAGLPSTLPPFQQTAPAETHGPAQAAAPQAPR